MIESGRISSFILWGPPGVGKTTLAMVIAHQLDVPFYTLSAVTSGVKDVGDVIEKARGENFFDTKTPILFIDEIHRFSKSQQDSLLGAVEQGVVTLIGATTENPSFEVIRPLLSRCQLYVLKPLEDADLLSLAERTLREDIYLKDKNIVLEETAALLSSHPWQELDEDSPEFTFVHTSAAKLNTYVGYIKTYIIATCSFFDVVIKSAETLKTYEGLVVRAYFRLGEAEKTIRLKFYPILTSSRAEEKINDYCPCLAMGEDRIRILRRIQRDTPFAIEEEMKITVP
jgi:hypothetical protein